MLWRDLRAWQIYGANTDVGKTVISTLLCKALARRAPNNGLLYLKPVSTGPQDEADDRHISKHAPGILSRCIKQYSQPLSPHLALKHDFPETNISFRAGKLNDEDWSLLGQVRQALAQHQQDGGRYAVVETAGGPLSPGPFGSVQADLYRPLRLPVLLVGDSRLGGISGTISAFESLYMRGYDVQSVILFDDAKYGNHAYLREYLAEYETNALAVPAPPLRDENVSRDQAALAEYYEKNSQSPVISDLIDHLHQAHFRRISKLTSMPAHAESIIWHPFRQYGLPQNVIAIDSAYADHFEAYNAETDTALASASNSTSSPPGLQPLASAKAESPLLTPLFDASASWWTQGLGHSNPTLALTAAHAASRYGHVMFANAIHAPALDLSYALLTTLQNPRLTRTFFSDNGSTGMEVAVKMALRASCLRYGWTSTPEHPVEILGLRGSYHGDTIGVMNCSEPSAFNEKVTWYQSQGHWFSPPEVKMVDGEWQVHLPSDMHHESQVTLFPSLSAIFDFESRQDDAQYYKDFITRTLTHLQHQGRRFGALILEPLIMGAGGMIFVDPLFQRTLIKTVRENPELIAPDTHQDRPNTTTQGPNSDALAWKTIPVIADEVFTGLHRLGRASSSSFLFSSTSANISTPQANLDVQPDISVHAKLLTAGLLPLALTTASDSIFQAFISKDKSNALLHGHSYTAHAVGCAVAVRALDEMDRLSVSRIAPDNTSIAGISSTSSPAQTSMFNSGSAGMGPWDSHRLLWKEAGNDNVNGDIFSFFSPATLSAISRHQLVKSAWAIGTVLALTLKSDGGGYGSNAAVGLQRRLLSTLDEQGRGVHSRVLGDVIYFMVGLETSEREVRGLEGAVLRALDREVEDSGGRD